MAALAERLGGQTWTSVATVTPCAEGLHHLRGGDSPMPAKKKATKKKAAKKGGKKKK